MTRSVVPAIPQGVGLKRPRGRDQKGEHVRINVPTAMAQFVFTPGSSTGVDSDCQPGVGIDVEMYEGQTFEDWTHGVMSRTDAKRLYDALGKFLAKHPPE